MTTPAQAPTVKTWMTATDAASELGVSRQYFNKMVQRGDFESLHKLGAKPIYVVQRCEVDRMKADRA
jgi:hypothetical protein